VLAKTLRGERTYYAAPDAGTSEHYAVIVRALTELESEWTLVARLTLRSALTMFAARVFHDVLVLEQLVWPADVNAAPGVPTAFRAEALPIARQLITLHATAFDPAAYRDVAADKLAEIVAGKDPTQAAQDATVTALPGAGGDVMAQLEAAM
jgi:non-homologous end joining protein Ku